MTATRSVDDLATHLSQAIAEGRYPVGALLPGERPLCVELGVGRPLLREAIRLLAARGLVESRHGQGTRVIADRPRPVHGALANAVAGHGNGEAHLLELRLAIECALAEAAARRRNEADLADLEDIFRTAEHTTDPDQLAELDVRFHARLAQAARNPLFDLVLAPLADLLRQDRPLGLAIMGADTAHADHRALLKAVRGADPAAAARAMRRHLGRLAAPTGSGTG
jgi:GntR family transcriptional repressor for pyruvate dehydrogenase complex